MKDFVDALRRQVAEFLEKRSKKQKIWICVTGALIIGLIIAVSLALGRVNYEVLYSGLDEAEAGQILSLLQEREIDARAQGTGTILVPSDIADELRMELASEGYPQSGLNYDIFSNASSFGKTDLEMKTYEQYQLQENLRRTILMLDKVRDCVVIINMAEDSLFVLSSDQQESGASVMLDLKNGETLLPREAKAIAELISKSVPGLKPENVRIVDTNLNLYDVNGQDAEEYTLTQYQLTEQVRETLSKQVSALLAPVFGERNISAAVNVVLDFDKENVNSVVFNPPVEGESDGLVSELSELYELTQGGGAKGVPGTESNGVDIAGSTNEGGGDGTRAAAGGGLPQYMYANDITGDFTKISRNINFELNQTQTQIEKAQGRIEELSVAVLLNSEVYKQDYSESVKQLVASAIGVDESLVSVVSLPFQASDGSSEISGVFERQASMLERQNKKDIITAVIVALTIIIGLIFLFRFLRQLVESSNRKKLPDVSEGYALDALEEGEQAEESLDIVDLRTKSSSADQIERFVIKDPAAVAQLLRNWLTDD